MWTLLLGVTFGLLASCSSSSSGPAQEVSARSCSHAGVFHVEGGQRYALTFDLASQLCDSLGASLASEEQIAEAYDKGLETCRYGWNSNQSASILRHAAHENCARNLTGIIPQPNTSPESEFDAYCYDDADAGMEKNCMKVINPDGGKMVSDDADVSTEELVTVVDEEKTDIQTQAADVDADAATVQPDPQDATSGPGDEAAVEESTAGPQGTAEPELLPVPEASPEAGEEAVAAGGDATTDMSVQDDEPAGGGGEETTQGAAPTGDARMVLPPDAGSGMMPPTEAEEELAAVTPGGEPAEAQTTTPTSTMTEKAEEPAAAEGEEVVAKEAEEEVKGAAPGEPIAGRMGPGTEPAPASQESSSSNWLLIVGVVIAVGAILLVCAAVAKRKSWCGQRQTLMISSSSKDSGAGEGNGNGAASAVASSRAQEREQEMVTLMTKEKIQENGNTEEFTVITLEESPEKGPLA